MEAEKMPVVQGSGFRGAVKEILGQFVTTTFWKGLVKSLVQEAFATFLMTLGGVLVHYGREKRNKDLTPMTEAPHNAARAFGGGYTPTPSFVPSTAFPLTGQQHTNAQFPGFGP